ncbi:MAG: L-seryl-tRNA(Sec) selenium transferase [Deferrisomatales bacterium]|nr:L-seryl-tRNA(Sec) selenium transferase [Deferrisomatales bacterium]
MSGRERLRDIPAVERVLQEPALREAGRGGAVPREYLAASVREVLDRRRRGVLAGEPVPLDPESVARESLELARERLAPRLVPVVNATGVVLHTNLGRAPLAAEAREAMGRAAGYCNLEYDLAEGRRGHRHDLVAGLLRDLTGAEAALAVNNNAAAVLLALSALARGREVVVSRGELVEIGGSFRIPEVLVQGGCVLREVGTTNRTHLRDYERAIGPETALLLRVHTSNYRVLGFTSAVSTEELVALGRRHGLPVVEDLGSGSLVDLGLLGLEHEPTVPEVVAAGVEVVTFSGDKLLGGPQAGLLVGRQEALEACARHPLMRALRPDKVTLAALEATLALYRDPQEALRRVPALAQLAIDPRELRARAETLAASICEALGGRAQVGVVEGTSEVGGGSLPLQALPTWLVRVARGGKGVSRLEGALRGHRPPVIARIQEDALLFDPRTLAPGEDRVVAAALGEAFDRDSGA